MKRFLKIKYIIPVGIVAAVAAFLYVYAVWHGYLLLNNPSRSRYPVRGVDVSHYQGSIDWPVLAGEDIRFAYIKATEGSSHVDRLFSYNWEHARQTNLAVGAYHFFSFDSSGLTQAENFINCVGAAPGMIAPVIDVEYYADKKDNPPAAESVRAELKLMLEALQSHYGMVPIIYSTEDVWEKYIKDYFDEYPLWIRNVITTPGTDADWVLWQYTNRGRLAGYQGEEQYIDINVFDGSLEQWQEFLAGNQ